MLRQFMRKLRRVVLALLLLVLAVGVALQLWFAAWIWHYKEHAPTYTPFMHLGTGSPGAPTLKYEWRDAEQIAHALGQAVLAAEDSRFVYHKGLEWEGIRNAYQKNKAAGAKVAGGSTLTQQLAKNLFLSRRKTYWRKGQEALIALMMEAMLSKERILTLYLNVAQWGHGIYGAEAAAQHFFHISAAELSAEQAAELAARLPGPTYYHDQGRTPWLQQYQHIILQRMPFTPTPTTIKEQ